MNVTALIDGTPGSQTLGQAVERYHYDPYGKVTFLEGSTGGQTEWNVRASQASIVANEVLFAGYRRDGETGLYHVRNRPYHPLLGRWLTRDPLGYVDGMSVYEYCGSAPVTSLDFSGLRRTTELEDDAIRSLEKLAKLVRKKGDKETAKRIEEFIASYRAAIEAAPDAEYPLNFDGSPSSDPPELKGMHRRAVRAGRTLEGLDDDGLARPGPRPEARTEKALELFRTYEWADREYGSQPSPPPDSESDASRTGAVVLILLGPLAMSGCDCDAVAQRVRPTVPIKDDPRVRTGIDLLKLYPNNNLAGAEIEDYVSVGVIRGDPTSKNLATTVAGTGIISAHPDVSTYAIAIQLYGEWQRQPTSPDHSLSRAQMNTKKSTVSDWLKSVGCGPAKGEPDWSHPR